ncbi:uncharacterized protein LOC132546610 [Ylistrum balloti]|uniref:uncharacterized protein LOC132546610 n=1 Tax=Ylistrum balloti TaxID=509963 RepID=UPI002905C17E|nr:uncharacterized protein LOC132546610 [Ylistrum balloti]
MVQRRATKLSVWYLTLFSLLLWDTGLVSSFNCVKTGPCSCQLDDGTSVDLSPLSSSDVNNPTFLDVSGPTTSDIYSWNPCADFSEGPDNCQNVAVCDIHQNIPNAEYFSLGNTDSVSFTTDDLGQVTISYQYSNNGTQRNSHILLSCDPSQEGNFVPQGPLPDPTSPDYYFGLESKYICKPKAEKKGGISVGTIICIAALAIIVLYVSVGVSVNVFYRKYTGKQIIPNVSFWAGLPGLIKDGFKFLISGCKKSTVYDRI